MKINPYLNFDGQCEEAFTFYAECLGGQVDCMFRFGETPAGEHVPPDHRNKIMHARIAVGDQVLMGSDSTPDHPYEGVNGYSVSLNVDKPAEAERIFKAFSAGAKTVIMPLEQTFWAERFGMLVDRFGVPWMVNCEGAAKS
jgi:PhnB protein